MSMGTRVRTVGDLREVLAGRHDAEVILFEYDGPEECCDEHVHDITLVWGCDATVDVLPGQISLRLTGGEI